MRSLLKNTFVKQKLGKGYGFIPSLNLDFMNQVYRIQEGGSVVDKPLTDIVRTTRDSTAMYFDQFGVLSTAAANVLRFDFDPSTKTTVTSKQTLSFGTKTIPLTGKYNVGDTLWLSVDSTHFMSGQIVSLSGGMARVRIRGITGTGVYNSWTAIVARGILIESGRNNVALNSNAPNTLSATRSSYVDTGEPFPDGVGVLRLLREDTTAGATHFALPTTNNLAANTQYTGSWFVKAAGRTVVQLTVQNTGGWVPATPGVSFDLAKGTFTETNGAIGTMVDCGNGVYRIAMTATTAGSALTSTFYPVLYNGIVSSYNGDGVSGIFIGGYQLEAGTLSSYIPTTTTMGTRVADDVNVVSMSPWYTPSGTLSVKTETLQVLTGGYPTAVTLFQDSTNYISLLHATGNRFRTEVRVASAFPVTIGADAPLGKYNTLAFRIAPTDYACSVNRGAVIKSSYGTVPIVSNMRLGASATGGLQLNGHLASVKYIPTSVLDAYLSQV